LANSAAAAADVNKLRCCKPSFSASQQFSISAPNAFTKEEIAANTTIAARYIFWRFCSNSVKAFSPQKYKERRGKAEICDC
jgi:hypothetical protein